MDKDRIKGSVEQAKGSVKELSAKSQATRSLRSRAGTKKPLAS